LKFKAEQALKMNFEECLPQLSESELRSHRLDVFNEKITQLFDDQFTFKLHKNIEDVKKW
jgi:hypothetical protein